MPGRAFLNKKDFHTGSFKNMETVWIAEQKKLQQDKLFLEQKKRLLEEKYSEELKRMQVKAGLLPESALNKMEWMYRYNTAQDDQNIAEDYLLGKAVDPSKGLNPLEDDQKKQLKVQFDENDIFLAERQEHFVRLYEDPMFLMEKEKARRKKEIQNNPLKMREIFEKIAFEKARTHVAKIERLIKQKRKQPGMEIKEKLEKEREQERRQKGQSRLEDFDQLRRQMGFQVPRKPRTESRVEKKEKKTKKKKDKKKSKKTKRIKKKKKKNDTKSTSGTEKTSPEQEDSLTENLFNDYLQKRVGPNVDIDLENGKLQFKNKKRRKKRSKDQKEEEKRVQTFRENQEQIREAKERFLKHRIEDQKIETKKATPDFMNRLNQDVFVKKYGVRF